MHNWSDDWWDIICVTYCWNDGKPAKHIDYGYEEQEIRYRCNKLRAMLRRAWGRNPKRFDVLRQSRRPYEGENKRQRFEHQCNICKEWFKQSDVQVDHIVPAGSFLELTAECIDRFAVNLFQGELQVLCAVCHKKKTKEGRNK